MPRKRDYIDEIIKQGARVLPPKPVPEPVAVPIIQPDPVAEPVVNIADAVAQLDRRWHNPDPQRTTEIPATEYEEYEGSPEPIIGDIIDLVVVSFSHHDPTGRERGGIGLARIPRGPRRKGRRDGCHFVG